mmetsp:Transcript_25430/g.54985  ORF Transcript_25430/g.54985 Transcript_25430/m.54985 type:complete len:239 (-) Transcript_25430:1852-2568(-)
MGGRGLPGLVRSVASARHASDPLQIHPVQTRGRAVQPQRHGAAQLLSLQSRQGLPGVGGVPPADVAKRRRSSRTRVDTPALGCGALALGCCGGQTVAVAGAAAAAGVPVCHARVLPGGGSDGAAQRSAGGSGCARAAAGPQYPHRHRGAAAAGSAGGAAVGVPARGQAQPHHRGRGGGPHAAGGGRGRYAHGGHIPGRRGGSRKVQGRKDHEAPRTAGECRVLTAAPGGRVDGRAPAQ